ncbi:lysophospholipid acyltransferase family protein [Flavihumibacter sp. CACIAM 22H1]|uniref:lysophospholipid acyltransferase family protein n=1 Tax=Flavihumibacter sp. CACIAM 22H1 TaxID=1812911 RepID=UPI0007A87319|nr:lysophospholipid acyltransferase family protein [Flavihumibacter sp. CACIAM 22H1]KYP14018.1 MAG: acyl-phosphate glycerol 3-phosphate acyltransferase [Flavihumibacter sp. CACIAM 22H1]
MIKKIVQTIYSIYGFVLFILLLLLLLPFFFIASLFGKIRGGTMIYRICSWWADAWLLLIGIRTEIIHEEKNRESRPCIFVANHISYMDIPMIVKIIREPVRVLGKQEMASIPIFGFVYRNAVVLVNRKDPEQRQRSVFTLKKILGKGISIFIFPEGTFNETGAPLKSFYDGAFRIALETQTPIQPLIFPDTVKRLHYKSVFSLSPGKCRAVYLPLVSVNEYAKDGLSELKEKVYQEMEKGINTYK